MVGVHGSKSLIEVVEEAQLVDQLNLLGPSLTLKNPIFKSVDIQTKATMNAEEKYMALDTWHEKSARQNFRVLFN